MNDQIEFYDSLDIARQLEATSHWLDSMNCNVTYGLKCPADALILHRYFMGDENLPVFADEFDNTESGLTEADMRAHCIRAIGYDPIERGEIEAAKLLQQLQGDK